MKVEVDLPLSEVIKLIPGYDPYHDSEGYYFDEEIASNAILWIETCCTFTKGEWAGKPLLLEPWQKAVVANTFGWISEDDGTRRYREVFVYVPRKNGKTELLGAMNCYVLFCDGEEGAEIYSAAAEAEQAKIVWDVSRKMIENNELLLENSKVYKKSITHDATESFYKYITADANTKHGYNAHCATLDEVHAQANDELKEVLETSQGARRQPLFFYTTTADFDRPSLCNKLHKRACRIRDKDFSDPAFLPVVYEADKDDDWKDPETWKKANPNYGVSLKPKYFERQLKKALAEPSYENTFKRLHLNMKTEQANRWINLETWDKSGKIKDDRQSMIDGLKGRPCYAAFDLSSTIDITALVLLFPEDDFVTIPFFWIPEEKAAEKEEVDKVPYKTWIREELVKTTPGNRIDYNFIERDIVDILSDFEVRALAFDPWNATQISINLAERDGLPMMQFRQGWRTMNEPCKRLETDIAKGIVNHLDNPVLRWMASNVSIREDPRGNISIDKQKSSDKVDGMVALAMAYGSFLVEEADTESVYNTRGFLVFSDNDEDFE